MTPEVLPARLASKVSVSDDGCWLWTASLTRDGYGRIRWSGAARSAHRVVFTETGGVIPDGMTLDHQCHNLSDCPGGASCQHRRCVNPSHVRVVTHEENCRHNRVAMAHREATECPSGHPYEGWNVYRHPNGQRVCRTCSAEYQRAYRARKKAQAVA